MPSVKLHLPLSYLRESVERQFIELLPKAQTLANNGNCIIYIFEGRIWNGKYLEPILHMSEGKNKVPGLTSRTKMVVTKFTEDLGPPYSSYRLVAEVNPSN